ncbi:LysR family transcriptional regulator [Thalassovita sp.]|uniref:LysR family transcriptional regulator n=1 Tax=Thalassovita sp. TaxID=1979401 RepID=UPI0029DE51D3|nr:LysR family transcriptional regulator [Thalassovita sp.]
MTLDQLRIFLAVAEREHFTRAATALNLSQSAVSAAIATLEDRHAVRLFDRVGRRVVLTTAGRVFMAEARAVLKRAQQAEQLLSDLAGLKQGQLRLAASQTVASYWLPGVMVAFRTAYPGFDLHLTTGNSAQIIRLVREAEVDLGFVEGEAEDPALIVTQVPGDELALATAPGHHWAHTPPETADDLRAGPWVIREEGSGTRAILEATLAAHGLRIQDVAVALELPSNEAVKAAVEAGAGATILSSLVLGAAFESGAAVRIPFDLAPRQFRILQHRERRLSLAERRFLDLISKMSG